MAEIQFTKMHGAGNDYIYVDTTRFPMKHPEEAAIAWSAPHTGIGSDGLVLIGTSPKADFSMRIFNADGSEAMMCGNASRCIGKYVYEHGLTQKQTVTLDTLSGIKILELHIENGKVQTVTVDMGEPSEIYSVDLKGDFPYHPTHVSMGNPHMVSFIDDVEHFPLSEIGPQLEHYKLFPNRINVEFAQLIAKDTLRMRVWERGSGITCACGTGACATAVAAAVKGITGRKAEIRMDGGSVFIHWDETTNHVFMTGPATEVFTGVIEWNE